MRFASIAKHRYIQTAKGLALPWWTSPIFIFRRIVGWSMPATMTAQLAAD